MEKLPQAFMQIEWMESDFRNSTAKVWANLYGTFNFSTQCICMGTGCLFVYGFRRFRGKAHTLRRKTVFAVASTDQSIQTWWESDQFYYCDKINADGLGLLHPQSINSARCKQITNISPELWQGLLRKALHWKLKVLCLLVILISYSLHHCFSLRITFWILLKS